DGVVSPSAGRWLGLPGAWALLPLAALVLAVSAVVAGGGGEGTALRRVLAIMCFGSSLVLWRATWQPDPNRQHRFEQALEVGRVLTGETVFGRAADHGDTVSRGVEATSRGDNAAAIEVYRTIFR